MNSLKIKISALILLFIATVSCKSQYEALLNSNDFDQKYKVAFKYFNEGKYQKAAGLFESLESLSSNSSRSDTVLYYLGLSNYRYKDYPTAETRFTKFINTYQNSPFLESANFLRIDCLYRFSLNYELDQSATNTAINAIHDYVKDFPESEHGAECNVMLADLNKRLDKKAYESAKLYYKMEDYLASRVALRNVLRNNSENIYREDILYYIAMSSYKYAFLSVKEKQKERYLTFLDDYLNFVGENPDSPYKRELDALAARAQKAIGRDVTSGTDENLSEKDFEKERQKAEAK